jgi:hypothetical protein
MLRRAACAIREVEETEKVKEVKEESWSTISID